jgi:hypothetical protein
MTLRFWWCPSTTHSRPKRFLTIASNTEQSWGSFYQIPSTCIGFLELIYATWSTRWWASHSRRGFMRMLRLGMTKSLKRTILSFRWTLKLLQLSGLPHKFLQKMEMGWCFSRHQAPGDAQNSNLSTKRWKMRRRSKERWFFPEKLKAYKLKFSTSDRELRTTKRLLRFWANSS